MPRPGFALTAENAPRRGGDLPAAGRHAAGDRAGGGARCARLSPEQIAARLDDRFRLLTGGSRTALPRQQTLRATLDWSHDLLSEAEQALFRRLAVFAGSFGVEAVEGICVDDELTAAATLDLLVQLVEKSLMRKLPYFSPMARAVVYSGEWRHFII